MPRLPKLVRMAAITAPCLKYVPRAVARVMVLGVHGRLASATCPFTPRVLGMSNAFRSWPCGLMDKALVFGTKDCRFESCQGHLARADAPVRCYKKRSSHACSIAQT